MLKNILTLTLALSANAMANQNKVIESPHSVFIAAGFGATEFKRENSENNSYDFDDNASIQMGYRYQFTDIFSVDTRYINSSSFGFKEVLSLGLLEGSIDYSTFSVSGQARKSITQNSYLYGNLGVARYNWDYETSKIGVDDSGFGGLVSLGYRYQWSKIELSLEHQWLTMGDMKASNLTAEVGYRF